MNPNLKVADSATDKADVFNQIRALQSRVEELAETFQRESEVPVREQMPDQSSLVRSILKFRQNRRKYFDATIFGEPAWDMLLELYDAELRGRNESVSSMCLASGVPGTTALRWIKSLEEDGWVVRNRDPHDGRRIFVCLTEKAREATNKMLSAVGTSKSGASRVEWAEVLR